VERSAAIHLQVEVLHVLYSQKPTGRLEVSVVTCGLQPRPPELGGYVLGGDI
jgi:hypothetical protein